MNYEIYSDKYGRQYNIKLPMFNGCFIFIELSYYKKLKELKYDSFDFAI